MQNNNTAIRISIFGDTVCTNTNRDYFAVGDRDNLLGKEINQIIDDSDYCIFNLEAPITNCPTSIFKPGAPCLKSPMRTEAFFKAMGRKVILSCANNHIKDYGVEGIKDTISAAESTGNCTVLGVSAINAEEAGKPYIIDSCSGENKIGVYSCAENEFSIASDSEGGANGFDAIRVYRDISDLKRNCKNIIVLFHAGRENYRYPSPKLQENCRFMIDLGATIVICQHSHCIGCYEKYNGGTIVYGQGNFLFDRSNLEGWKTGLIIYLLFEKGVLEKITYVPVKKEENKVRIASPEEKLSILCEFEKRSDEIKDPLFTANEWSAFCSSNLHIYILQGLYGINNRYILAIDRKLNFFISKILIKRKAHRKLLLNFIRCESINEAMKAVLDDD